VRYPKVSFKSKRNHLIKKGGFIVPLQTSILSGVIGKLINNNKQMSLNRMILLPPE